MLALVGCSTSNTADGGTDAAVSDGASDAPVDVIPDVSGQDAADAGGIRNGSHSVSATPPSQPCGTSSFIFVPASVIVTTIAVPSTVSFDWGLGADGLTVTTPDTGPLTNDAYSNPLDYNDGTSYLTSTDVGHFNADGSFDTTITQKVTTGSATGPTVCNISWMVHGMP